MPFYRRFESFSEAEANSSISKLVDSHLVQPSDYWNGSWLFFPEDGGSNAGCVRKVSDFTATSGGSVAYLTPEFNFDHAVVVGDDYELLSVFSPLDVHRAINRSIQDGFPSFFDTINDETLILEQDQLTYSLEDLDSPPWVITKAWLEVNSSALDVEVESSANGSVTLTDAADISDVEAGWLVSAYYGTGSGQLRTVSSVTGQQVVISQNWVTNPDTDTKLKIWNPDDQQEDWYRLLALRFNQKENPTAMYFTKLYSSAYGMRIRLQYITAPSKLTADDDTTVVPSEYIINKAMAILLMRKANDNRVDRQRYLQQVQGYLDLAEHYRQTQGFRIPDITRWQEEDPNSPSGSGSGDNPLNW
jgi:hypothetical protein